MQATFGRAFQIFAHASSQLTGCYDRTDPWLLQPSPLLSSHEAAEQWGSDTWDRWFRHNYGLISARFPWVESDKFKATGAEKVLAAIRENFHSLRAASGGMIVAGDSLYPYRLFHTDRPPYALCYLGNPELLNRQGVAVIGARKADLHAVKESYQAGRLLANLGYVTVSGGAYGCDIAAHQGVLSVSEGEVPAVVVFAGGLNRLYPRGNLREFNKIKGSGGVLISERLTDQVARPYDFPVRNRIICGLVNEVLVMQAGSRSGALTTAKIALDQGREVLVLTPDADAPGAGGSRSLIEDGATAFTSSRSLLRPATGNSLSQGNHLENHP